MKFRILSDLHNEYNRLHVNDLDCDAVILPGDIDAGTAGAHWALESFRDKPILYVAGNHEYYGSSIDYTNQQLTQLSEHSNLIFLNNQEYIIGTTRFLGSTLWINYRYGEEKVIDAVRAEAITGMADYERIAVIESDELRHLTPEDAVKMKEQSIHFLEEKLKTDHPGSTVIITHHLPSPRSLYPDDRSFSEHQFPVPELERLIMTYQPELWIHGHRHLVQDYMIGQTRVICNPRGYAGIKEAKGFDPDFILEI